jgi:tetratricopeptide (TPR) repeat protein
MKQGVFAIAVIMLAGVASDAAAQRQFVPASCDINKGHYLVNSAVLYLQNAGRTRFPDQRQRDLRDANRVLTEAISEKGQDQNGGAWYFLGRYYQEMNDIDGADSAFDRAERLAPQCAADIRENRRRLWVPLLNGAVDKIKAGDNAAAIAQLQRANRIFDAEPPGFYYLGQLYANMQQRDSAIFYFERALTLATNDLNRSDAAYADIRTNAAFNVARLFHMEEEYDSAVVWYGRVREVRPTDPQALTGMATAFESGGRVSEALMVYDSVLLLADSMTTLDLFQAGVAMFRVKRFDRAAEAFERGLQRNPLYRDALFNLGNTYLSLASVVDSTKTSAEITAAKRAYGAKMTPVVTRLVAVDPANTASLRLLAASFQLQDQPDSTLAVLQRIEALPFDVTVSSIEPTPGGFDVRGVITNLRSTATPVPAITFEFLNAEGGVVQSLPIDAQNLEAEGVAPFALQASGDGIVAWRYRVGS